MAGIDDGQNSLFRVPKSAIHPTVNQTYLTVHLNYLPKHNFRPGELIVGKVTIISFAPITQPLFVTLTLSGKVKVTVHSLSTKRTSSYKNTLFQISQILSLPDNASAESTTYTIPFTFNFPSHYISKSGKHEILPPSLTCNSASPTNPSAGSFIYKIKAKLPSTNQSLEAETDLLFCTPRTVQLKDIANVGKGLKRTISYRQSPDTNAARPSRRRDSLPWNKTKTNVEQKLTLEFGLWHPTKVILGERLKITMRIQSCNKEDVKGKEVLPEFRMNGALAVDFEHAIMLRDCAEPPATPQEFSLQLLNKFSDPSNDGHLVTIDKDMIFNDIVLKGQTMIPTFMERAIAVKTTLIIGVSLKVMGKLEKFYVKSEVEVLPACWRARVEGEDEVDEVVNKIERVELVEDSLPEYKEKEDGKGEVK